MKQMYSLLLNSSFVSEHCPVVQVSHKINKHTDYYVDEFSI